MSGFSIAKESQGDELIAALRLSSSNLTINALYFILPFNLVGNQTSGPPFKRIEGAAISAKRAVCSPCTDPQISPPTRGFWVPTGG